MAWGKGGGGGRRREEALIFQFPGGEGGGGVCVLVADSSNLNFYWSGERKGRKERNRREGWWGWNGMVCFSRNLTGGGRSRTFLDKGGEKEEEREHLSRLVGGGKKCGYKGLIACSVKEEE